jgi:hypothetical protein
MKENSANGRGPLITRYKRQGKEVVRFNLPQGRPPTLLDISRLIDPRDLKDVMEYRLVEMLGKAGYAHQCIAEVTGHPTWQISKKLHALGIRVSDYRNGRSKLSQAVIGRAIQVSQSQLVDNMSKQLFRLHD